MSDPVLCECGAVLVAGVDENGVTLVSGEYLQFKRKTDYVACPECLRSYPARDLLLPKTDPEPFGLETMLEPDEEPID